MPNQTLYDNFSQVRQYIDQEKPDLSSYVTKTELSNCSYATNSELSSYLPLTGGTLSGNLFAGDQEKTTVTFLATRRKCGGESGTSYMASFFTNSDGRSKFAHKSYTGTKTDVSNDVDDAFMCFNAYGFKVAYSGTQGVAASTEYELLHTGNIQSFIPTIDENIIPKENNTYTLGDSSYFYSTSYITDMWLNSTNKFSNRSNNQINLMLNNAWKYVFHANNFSPANDNAINLGESSVRWGSTYTARVDLNSNIALTSDNSGLFVKTAGNLKFSFDADSFHPYGATYGGNIDLGSSSRTWRSTYTNNLYLNGYNIINTINGIFSYDSSTGTLSITTIS